MTTNTTNDGGPAFPVLDTLYGRCPETGNIGDVHVTSSGGLSLRDYFAAQSLTGIIATPMTEEDTVPKEGWPTHYANFAYAIADAMLKARGK